MDAVLDPAERPATNTPEHDDLRAEIRDILANGALNQATIARQAGLTDGVISSFMLGKYKGDNDKIAAQLAAWAKTYRSRKHISDVIRDKDTLILTPTAQRIRTTLSHCRTMRDFSMILGGPGVSKSHAATRFARENPPTWIVTGRPSMAARHAFLVAIVSTLKGRDMATGTDLQLSEMIINHLSTVDGMLIVDEVQYFHKSAIDELRAIYDATETPMCMIGNLTAKTKLHGDGISHEFRQLIRRTNYMLMIERPQEADAVAVARHFGIEGDEEIAILQEIAQGPKAISGAIQAIRVVLLNNKGEGPVSAASLREVHDEWTGKLIR